MTSETKKRIADINKGIIPEGYKKTKVGIVPVEWEIVKLSGIGKNYIGLTYTPEDTANTGLIVLRSSNIKDSKIDLNDCVYVKCEVSEKNRVKHNDILICARNGSSGLIGKSALITEAYSDLAFGAFMSVYRTKYYNYIFQAFQSFIIKKQILRNLGARINQITTADINQFKVPFPPLPEQQKIAEILSAQDKLIELQEKKIERLKELKKAYLQKMFPKKGSKYPKLRFKGFTDPWEQRKLGELADIVGGGTPSTSNSEYWDGDIDWYAPAEIANQIFVSSSERKITQQGYDNSSAKMLPVGTVLFTSRAGIGKTAILRKEGCTNQGFQSIVPHENMLDSYFIFSRTEELKRYGEIKGAGSTFVEVSGKQMASMELMMPKTIEEQKKIGSYFSQLDNLITLHQRKSEQEKQKKKALMQLLLTGKVRCI